jgi:hypothetical protein
MTSASQSPALLRFLLLMSTAGSWNMRLASMTPTAPPANWATM